MTVIAITKFRPHAGKANLVLQNMKDVVSEFDKMGMTARISRDMLGPDAGCLTFSSFHAKKSKASCSGLNTIYGQERGQVRECQSDD